VCWFLAAQISSVFRKKGVFSLFWSFFVCAFVRLFDIFDIFESKF